MPADGIRRGAAPLPGTDNLAQGLAAGQIHVWTCRLHGVEPAYDVWAVPKGDAWAVLGTDERARADRFPSAAHRDHFVRRRAALRLLVGRYSGLDPSEVAFDTTCHRCRDPLHGKPRVMGAGGLSFSASSSDDLALVALADGFEIGVDVERLDRNLDPEQFFSAFGPLERRALARIPRHRRREAFFSAWVQKEALLKVTGAGLVGSLQQVPVDIDPTLPPSPPSWRPARVGDSVVLLFSPLNGYVACVAAEGAPDPPRVRWLDL